MTREGDILHQNGGHYVHRDRLSRCLTVYRPSTSATHALSDCSFTDDADGLSLARARCDYLARATINRKAKQ